LSPCEIQIPAELQRIGLHPAEQLLLALMRHLQHGTLSEVRIVDGLPVFVKQVHANVKLI
jgi:hypothetical protein